MAFFQSKHLWVKQLADGVAVLMLDREQYPANFLDVPMLDDLERALDAVIAANEYRLLVIRSGKTANFCHGPSPSLVSSWKIDDFRTWTQRGQSVCSKLADMPIASACVIAGACFDSGLELALACDHRVVVDRPSTSLGFPQLEWGMIPCWGGTQRLPHLVGLDNSLLMLLAGRRLDAREASQHNLADDLADEAGEEPPAFLANPTKRDWTAFPWRTWRQRWLESNRLGRQFLFRGAERILRTRIPDEMPAQGLMLEALRQLYQQPSMQAGLEFEQQALEFLATHPALGNLLRLLLHREQLRLPSIGSSEKTRINQIGIVGDGPAALALLLHGVMKGHECVLHADNEEKVGAAIGQVVLLLQAEAVRGAMTSEQLTRTISRIRGTPTWDHFERVDLVLDTTAGALPQKRERLRTIEKRVPVSALLIPVASPHRIADVQDGLQHPERVIGLNIIEPWNRGSLAEIAAPPSAAQPDVQRLREWAVALGKCCLLVPDRVGGLAMRVWLPALNEAGLLVKEGVPIERIDLALRRFGMSYGPLEWMDRLGIERIAELVASMKPLFAGRLELESGFDLMVEKQWLGNKSGLGFYQRSPRKASPHRAAVQLWRRSQGETPRPVPALSEADSQQWVRNRLVTLMSLEALRCLEDGLVKDADDLDCALCLTGWASHRGGPIGYARQLGTAAMTTRCIELANAFGPRFAPIDVLAKYLG